MGGKRITWIPIIFFTLVMVAGCGKVQQNSGLGENIAKTTSKLIIGDGAFKIDIPFGQSVEIKLSAIDEEGKSVTNFPVEWNTSNGAITSKGVFTANKPGNGMITVRAFIDGKPQNASLPVNVTADSLVGSYFAVKESFLFQDRIPTKFDSIEPRLLSNALQNEYGSLKNFLATLRDSHLQYVTAEEDRDAEEYRRDSYGGIGQISRRSNTGMFLEFIIPNSPASKAGLKRGDIIYEVDSRSVANLTESETNGLIRGLVGHAVQIKIRRGIQDITLDIQREEIIRKQAYGKNLEAGIGYIRIASITTQTLTDLAAILEDFPSYPRGLIIDLRGTDSGEMGSAVELAGGAFVPPSKTIAWVQRSNSVPYENKSRVDIKIRLPVVLLIDGHTAGPSEIFAAALLENGVATAVGEKSLGDGSSPTKVHLTNGDYLYVTTSEYLTPSKKSLMGSGITPTVIQTISVEDMAAGRDPQLDKAGEELKKSFISVNL